MRFHDRPYRIKVSAILILGIAACTGHYVSQARNGDIVLIWKFVGQPVNRVIGRRQLCLLILGIFVGNVFKRGFQIGIDLDLSIPEKTTKI
jgi:hypothetical protein